MIIIISLMFCGGESLKIDRSSALMNEEKR